MLRAPVSGSCRACLRAPDRSNEVPTMHARPMVTQILSLGLLVALTPFALPSAPAGDTPLLTPISANTDAQPPHGGGVDPQVLQMSTAVDAAQFAIDAYLEERATEQRAVDEYLARVEEQRAVANDLAAYESRVQWYMQRKAGGAPSPADEAAWDALAQCETGRNWRMRGSQYSGGLGFYNGTWSGYGGREFAANAGAASREDQITVGRTVQAAHGWSAWGCARTLGWVR